MPIKLRDYQVNIKTEVYSAWKAGHKAVLMIMPTGSGKTKTFCSVTIDLAVLSAQQLPTAIMVHRKELVQQISLTLAEEGIVHNIIAPRTVIKGIVSAHRRLLKRQYYDHNSIVTVVSVDTMVARHEKLKSWSERIRLWITDEAAHLLKTNKWGKAVSYFPNAIGLGVTATPARLDKKGLGTIADGVFDVMVQGPSTRWLIDNKYLSKYKIAIPHSDYQQFLGKASEGSDYSKEAMVLASNKSHIVGDVVVNYNKFAAGKQAILFASDIATGRRMEEAFTKAGIKAKILTGDTPDQDRLDALVDFSNKKIQVLLNVDLFDEGLDVPGIECVIMARPTKSLGKYLQMIGRGLRVAAGKEFMILIDHVGNVTEHGLPDTFRKWTLERTARRRDKINYIRICSNIDCNAPYDRVLSDCPWCGEPAFRNARGPGSGKVPPKQVDGDLYLIDPETLRELESQAELEDPGDVGKRVSHAAGAAAGLKAAKDQIARIQCQKELATAIAKWAGIQKHRGISDRGIHKKFYLEYEMTITEALGLKKAEMLYIMERVGEDVENMSHWR